MFSRSAPAYAALMLAAALWGSNPVVARLIGDAVPPVALSWLRWLLALFALAPLVWRERGAILSALRCDWRILLTLALLANVPQSALIYKALQTTTAVNVGLLNSTIPVLILLAGRLFFSSAIAPREAGGIALSMAGVAIILFQGSIQSAMALSLNPGDLIAFGGMLTWAFYTLLLPRRPQLSLLAFVAAMSVLGLVSTIPALLAEAALDGLPRIDPATMVGLAYIALGPTLVGTLAYSYGAERVGALHAGIFVHFMPLFASLFAVLALSERLHAYHLAGFALVVGGALFALDFRRWESSLPGASAQRDVAKPRE